MDITYIVKSFRDFPLNIRGKLVDLTFRRRSRSGMAETVKDGGNPICCVAFEGNKIIGWALIGSFLGHTDVLMIYVKKNYRGKGVGKILAHRLYKDNLNVIIHDKNSQGFWKKFNNFLKLNLIYVGGES